MLPLANQLRLRLRLGNDPGYKDAVYRSCNNSGPFFLFSLVFPPAQERVLLVAPDPNPA